MSGEAGILVVGAGPVGLALALQAHDHGAQVRIVERRPEAFRPSRALIVHPRTLEQLRPLGVSEPILARANTAPAARLRLSGRKVRVDLDAFEIPDTAFPHLTLVRQMDVETVLAEALAERGLKVERGVELLAVEGNEGGARATLRSAAGAERVECRFVAGCDGPESTVRRCLGIDWRGRPYREEVVLADVELDADLERDLAHVAVGRRGLLLLIPLGEQATWRLLATRPASGVRPPFGQPGPGVAAVELQALLDEAGFDLEIGEPAWSARYRLQRRLAGRYRRGPVFLTGEAAHAWSPAMGQGMNIGLQDALNLGWKLAFAAAGGGGEALLDSYELERRPAARRMLAMTRLAFWAESSTGRLPSFLRGRLAPLAAPAAPFLFSRRRLVAEVMRTVSQLRVAYPDSPLSVEGSPRPRGWPRAGSRLPDELVTCDGQRVRLHDLLAEPGIHVLLQRDADYPEGLDFGPRVAIHRLTSAPGEGLLAVRPDGYVGFRCGVADPGQFNAWRARIGAA